MTHMPIADASSLIFTAPIFTTLLATVVLRERLAAVEMLACLVGFAGVVCVVQPQWLFGATRANSELEETLDGEMSRSFVSMVALLAAMSVTFAFLVIRKIKDQCSGELMVFWMGFVGSFVGPIGAVVSGQGTRPITSLATWLTMVMIGLLGFAGQQFMQVGLKLERAGPASMMRNLDIVLAYVYQILLLGQGANPLSLAGAVLICLSAVAIAVSKIYDSGGDSRGGAVKVPDTDEEAGEEEEVESAGVLSGV